MIFCKKSLLIVLLGLCISKSTKKQNRNVNEAAVGVSTALGKEVRGADAMTKTSQVLHYPKIPNMFYFLKHDIKKLITDLFEKKKKIEGHDIELLLFIDLK